MTPSVAANPRKNCYSFTDAYDTEEEIPCYVLDEYSAAANHDSLETTAMKPTFVECQKLKKEFANEVGRMKKCLQDAGSTITDDEAVLAWAAYSDDLCAGWLALPEDDTDLREILIKYLPTAKSLVWRVTGIEAGDGSGDLFVPLPSDLLVRLGWEIGTELSIEQADDGSLVLRQI